MLIMYLKNLRVLKKRIVPLPEKLTLKKLKNIYLKITTPKIQTGIQ